MTPEQLHILQHALGVDKFGLGEQYRNHYVGGGARTVLDATKMVMPGDEPLA